MTELLLFCIATVGMTSIIVQGVIFFPFRKYVKDLAEASLEIRALEAQEAHTRHNKAFIEWFDELVNCAQCTGFWCGLFCGLFLLTSDTFWISEFDARQILNRLLMWFCCGVAGGFLAPLGCNMIDWLFYRKMNALRQLEEQDLTLEERRGTLP